jgi:hypothetical protein
MDLNQEAAVHTVPQTLALHLVPGALLAAFYFAVGPWVVQAGYPGPAALWLGILLVMIPFELGTLLFEGRRGSGRPSFAGVVLNREPMPLWQYFLFVPVLLAWTALAFFSLIPLDNLVFRTLFAWMPAWSDASTLLVTAAQYPRSVLQVTAVSGILVSGIAGPVVEELYFRGYLMPRIPTSARWAPLVSSVLFSLYHFFSPWQFVTRIIAGTPMLYAVAWKRNLYLSMTVHCLLNTLGMLYVAAQVFS